MKNVIEARRNEAYTAKPDEDLESPDSEVNSNKGTIVFFFLFVLGPNVLLLVSINLNGNKCTESVYL